IALQPIYNERLINFFNYFIVSGRITTKLNFCKALIVIISTGYFFDISLNL
ncbi:unnamed protein product, partial [marine sediment metagenome]